MTLDNSVQYSIEPAQQASLDSPDALVKPLTTLPTQAELNVLTEIANHMALSGMPLPKDCPNSHALVVKLLVGRELGLSPMVSLHEIDIIEGKAAMPARTQIALVRRRKLGDIRVLSQTDTGAKVEAWRTGEESRPTIFEFNEVDAKRAELIGGAKVKQNWKRWPKSMYLARAISLATHALWQEIFLGVAYTADELGQETDEDGRPVRVQLVDTAAQSGISLKKVANETVQPPPAEIVPQAATQPQPEAPKPEVTKPVATDSEAAVTQQIKMLIERFLSLTASQFARLKVRFNPQAPNGIKMTLSQLTQFRDFLMAIKMLRWAREEMKIDDARWQNVLQKRNVSVDIDLSEEDVASISDKLWREIAPFKRSKAAKELADSIGLPLAASSSAVGN